MQHLLLAVNSWALKTAYHQCLKDVAGHVPSLQRVDRGYDILVRDSSYTIVNVLNDPLTFHVLNRQNVEQRPYVVNIPAQSCSCPDSAEQGNLCKHRLALKILLTALRLQKAAEQEKMAKGAQVAVGGVQ